MYDLDVSIQYLDENPAKKTETDMLDAVKIGENVYYIEYSTQVEEAFKKNNNETIKLGAGDYLKIEVKNKNETLYQVFKRALYSLSTGKTETISGLHVGIIMDNTEGKQAGESVGAGEIYTITYNANGGYDAPAPQTKNKGENLILSDVIPRHSNSDLRFCGWSENPNDLWPTYLSGEIFTKDSDTTLYAIWTRELYKVVYLPNLSEVVNGLPTQDTGLEKNQSYTIWEGRESPSAKGYVFKNWNTLSDGSGTPYNSGQTINEITENIVLYATWDKQPFTLKYDKNINNVIVDNMPGEEECQYYESFTVSYNIPTRNDNYKFIGWSTTPNGDVEYKPGESCTMVPYNDTLYAIWGEKHTLEYNTNTKVLVVGYKNSSWVNSAVNYLNNIEELSVEGMTIVEGQLEKVAEKKDDYDVIIVNASAWSLNTIDNQDKNLIKEIANSAHVITFGNDEQYIPLIEEKNHWSNTTMDITSTEKGNELIGLNINTQSDSSLYSIKFKSDVTVLYTGIYKDDSTGEQKAEGDVIGVGQYVEGNNWIHGQIKIVNNELLYRLIKVAINGLEKTENMVRNIPGEEIHGNKENFNLSTLIPEKNNSVFMGWSNTPNGDVVYQSGGEFIMPDADVVLYAVWGSKLEYCANTTVLVVEYNKENPDIWLNPTVNYFNSTGQFIADGMSIGGGELEKVVAEKDNYDLIIINASAWSPTSISNNARNELISIANSTHLITLGNDERNIPLIKSSTHMTNANIYLVPNKKGRELIGEEILRQSDSALYSITFNSDVTVLYVSIHKDISSGEEMDAGDAIGFCKWTENTNWVHGQLNYISDSALYKLSRVAINGLDKVENPIGNMPQNEVRKHNSTYSLSSNIPTRKGSTFIGWAETPTGEVKYIAGQSFRMPRGNKKLYAVWE